MPQSGESLRSNKRKTSLERRQELEQADLYPIRADVAEWLSLVLNISPPVTAESFLSDLATGEHLCALAEFLRHASKKRLDLCSADGYSELSSAEREKLTVLARTLVRYRRGVDVVTQAFFARDNAANFLTFARALELNDTVLFTSNGLVEQSQPKLVLLALLEVARRASRLSIIEHIPQIVHFEHEIEAEEAAEAAAASAERISSPSSLNKTLTHESSSTASPTEQNIPTNQSPLTNQSPSGRASLVSSSATKTGKVEEAHPHSRRASSQNKDKKKSELPELSLDELVSQTVAACTCCEVYPVRKIGEGKYLIGPQKMKVFCRVLRNHVMVRVGGGWTQLITYLGKHDPCRSHERAVSPLRGHQHSVSPPSSSPTSPEGSRCTSPSRKEAPVHNGMTDKVTPPRRGRTIEPAGHARVRSFSPAGRRLHLSPQLPQAQQGIASSASFDERLLEATQVLQSNVEQGSAGVLSLDTHGKLSAKKALQSHSTSAVPSPFKTKAGKSSLKHSKSTGSKLSSLGRDQKPPSTKETLQKGAAASAAQKVRVAITESPSSTTLPSRSSHSVSSNKPHLKTTSLPRSHTLTCKPSLLSAPKAQSSLAVGQQATGIKRSKSMSMPRATAGQKVITRRTADSRSSDQPGKPKKPAAKATKTTQVVRLEQAKRSTPTTRGRQLEQNKIETDGPGLVHCEQVEGGKPYLPSEEVDVDSLGLQTGPVSPTDEDESLGLQTSQVSPTDEDESFRSWLQRHNAQMSVPLQVEPNERSGIEDEEDHNTKDRKTEVPESLVLPLSSPY